MTLVRSGIRQALTGSHGIFLVGEAASGNEAAREVRRSGADVLIYDASETIDDALKCLALIRRQAPRTHMLLLADDPSGETLFRAASLGVSGMLGPDATREELIRAVRRVGAGQAVLGTAMFQDRFASIGPVLRSHEGHRPGSRRAALSRQELSIVRAIAEGSTDRQIAAHMAISVATVKAHVRSILKKTGAPNRTGAIAVAFRNRVLA